MRILKGEKEIKHRLKQGLVVTVIILFFGMSVIPSTSSVVGEGKFPPELYIDGPTQAVVGEPLEYIFILIDPEGCNFSLFIDWDDGNDTGWLGPYPSNEEIILTYIWYRSGNYTIRANARDDNGSQYSATLNVTIIDNHAPEPPQITGARFVKAGILYECTVKVTDPDGDNVYYTIDWGDGTLDDWFGPFVSGEEVKRNHDFGVSGTVRILAIAKDIHGAIGDTGSMKIIIPKSKQIFNLPFLQFLQSVLQFLLLQRLLGWLI